MKPQSNYPHKPTPPKAPTVLARYPIGILEAAKRIGVCHFLARSQSLAPRPSGVSFAESIQRAERALGMRP